MKKLFMFAPLLLAIVVSANNDILIQQGQTQLTLKDVDGFAFKMPNDIRARFFSKPARVEKTLGTLLNMKHVYEYTKENKLIDDTVLTKSVNEKVQSLFAYDPSTDNLMEKENTYKAIRKFLELEQNYKMFQQNLIKDISDDDVMEYAKEYYQLHKSDYKIPESREIQYLSIAYDENTKDEIQSLVTRLLISLKNNKTRFNEVPQRKGFSEAKLSNILKYFTYSNKQKKFSDFVFDQNSIGIIDDVLILPKKFILARIINITPAKTANFDEVKPILVEKFKKEKFERDFKNILMQLTKDKIEINDNNMQRLITRYN